MSGVPSSLRAAECNVPESGHQKSRRAPWGNCVAEASDTRGKSLLQPQTLGNERAAKSTKALKTFDESGQPSSAKLFEVIDQSQEFNKAA
ncbi:hypothetical protein NDU88_002012 [Pleurodeles waltl]|uniref:Uncharacterized protein n=1 Tax=Pleurodeles waltl TaxID=8319 RepID=A0AAV7W0N5_PLEWA|nr:hypothetical protein NDU88_002012 [Pleurodeles waltl]